MSFNQRYSLALANETDVGVSGLVQRSIAVPAPFFQWLLEHTKESEDEEQTSRRWGCAWLHAWLRKFL